MASNSSQIATASALVTLLTDHPELSALTWTVDTADVLHGQQTGAGSGLIVDQAARVLGGTPVHARINRGTDRIGLAQFATVWRGVHVEVWASYATPEPRRPLGTVAVLTGGAR
ncbi:hypothetical protein AB0D24_04980 [Streptomyces javensis]|uniref:hypothetical protein n=1 Tax=Streptomyces javensis TaxID=114698 RepID=UPI0033CA4E8E